MKKPTSVIFLGLCGAGLLSGMAVRYGMESRRTVESSPISGVEGMAPPPMTFSATMVRPRSADSLATLLVVGEPASYARLAAWMATAGADDIAAYWEFYRNLGDPSDKITQLVFLNWTRVDPQAAISHDTPDRHAWWAWACHDPQAALAAAIAAGPDYIPTVARGIGEFQPDWLRRHFDEIPDSARKDALAGMGKWGDVENPMAMVEFSRKFGLKPDFTTLKVLTSKDPWTAFDWVKENESLRYDPFMDQFVAQMAEESPDRLARLASQTPPGTAKRKMETALFQNLLKMDPEAAIAEAKAIQAPRLAAERLAAVGLSLVKSDPERAMEMAESLLTICPDAMMKPYSLSVPGRRTGGGASSVVGVVQLMDSLLSEDPVKLLDMVVAKMTDEENNNSGLESLSDQWLERDMVGYAEWLKRQSAGEVRNRGTQKVIWRLQGMGEYRDAADWAMSMPVGSRNSMINSVTMGWATKDARGASEWLEAADLPEAEKVNLFNGISRVR